MQTGHRRASVVAFPGLLVAACITVIVAACATTPGNPQVGAPTTSVGGVGNSGIAYGPSSSNLADVYPARTGDGPRPVVIWIHGGGWSVGSRADVPAGVLALRDLGFAVVSIDHSLSPSAVHPAAVLDVKRAATWVVAQGPGRGFDIENVFLAGHSSGGHLAMLAGLTHGTPGFAAGEPRVRGVISVAGPTHLEDLLGRDALIDIVVRQYMGCQPISFDHCNLGPGDPDAYVDATDPALLLLHGVHDSYVPVAQSRRMAEVATAAGADVLLFESDDDHNTILSRFPTGPAMAWMESRMVAGGVGPTVPSTSVPDTTVPDPTVPDTTVPADE